jgi:hypothetical protein
MLSLSEYKDSDVGLEPGLNGQIDLIGQSDSSSNSAAAVPAGFRRERR